MSDAAVPNSGRSRGERPRVSVVMPVYNALPHLDLAMESILGQTFTDFEFVILDDASTDGSTERLREWAARDSRIRLIEAERNLGPALSSDRVARSATAPIVARQDADDISYPERLAAQLAILDRHPDVGVVGGLYDVIGPNGRKLRSAEPWRLTQQSGYPPFGNGPMTYRQEVYDRAGGYRKECEYWEDYDLLIRMSAVTRVMVIPHAVYQVRQSTTSTRYASEQARVEVAIDLMYRSRSRLARNENYEDLLKQSPPANAKLDPRVFMAMGSITLWTGGRPRLFKRLLRRGDLSLNFRTFSGIVWTAWASLNPASLRVLLRFLMFARNLYASATVRTDGPIYWSPSIKYPVGNVEMKGAASMDCTGGPSRSLEGRAAS